MTVMELLLVATILAVAILCLRSALRDKKKAQAEQAAMEQEEQALLAQQEAHENSYTRIIQEMGFPDRTLRIGGVDNVVVVYNTPKVVYIHYKPYDFADILGCNYSEESVYASQDEDEEDDDENEEVTFSRQYTIFVNVNDIMQPLIHIRTTQSEEVRECVALLNAIMASK